MHVGLAKDDGASFLELDDDSGVVVWNEILQDFRARRRSNPCRIDVVLQRNGNTVERAAIAMTFAAPRSEKFRFSFLGLSKGKFSADGEVGV
jgi:hypothetical protein